MTIMRKQVPKLSIVGVNWQLLNQRLLAITMVGFLLGMAAFLILVLGISAELHQIRVEISAQGSALQATAAGSATDIEARLRDIHEVLQGVQRISANQLTDVRSAIKNASVATQAAATKQLKTTTEVLKDQLESTKDAVVGAVESADTSAQAKKAPAITITPPPAPAPIVIPVAPALPPPPPVKKRHGPLRRFFTYLGKSGG